MKQGPVEIVLINPADNSQYVERRINGMTYFEAAPGQEFKVSVTINNKTGTHARKDYLRCEMHIEGQSAPYWITLLPENLLMDCNTFYLHGFLMEGKYHSFAFSDSVNEVTSCSVNAIGTIDISIYTRSVSAPCSQPPSIVDLTTPQLFQASSTPSATAAGTQELRDFASSRWIRLYKDCALVYQQEAPSHSVSILNLLGGDNNSLLDQHRLPCSTSVDKKKKTAVKPKQRSRSADDTILKLGNIKSNTKTGKVSKSIRPIPLIDLNEVDVSGGDSVIDLTDG